MVGFAWHVAGIAATALFIVGLGVRLGVKDHFAGICAIYYAAPPVVLAVFAATAAWYWRGRGKRLLSGGFFAAAVLCAVWFFQSSYVVNPAGGEASGFTACSSGECFARGPASDGEAKGATNGNDGKKRQGPPGGNRVRLLFWNLCNCRFGWEGITATIRQNDPDVIALAESGSCGRVGWFAWRKAFPEYSMTLGSENLLILCRGRIEGVKLHRLTAASRFETADIATRGTSFKLILADLESATLRSRVDHIARLSQVAESFDREPLVMAGDFNLPIDSVHFEMFEGRLQNAFRGAGNGYAPTWPMPAPVLQIDHVWTNRQVFVESCTTGWTRYSDHRPVVVDFVIASPKGD